MSRAAGPVNGGDRVIAFVDDPTGYEWEIIGSQAHTNFLLEAVLHNGIVVTIPKLLAAAVRSTSMQISTPLIILATCQSFRRRCQELVLSSCSQISLPSCVLLR